MRRVGQKHKNCPDAATDYSEVFYGWLTADGNLYPCKYRGHDRLAQYLGYKDGAHIEEAGKAVKLMNEAMFDDGITEPSFFYPEWVKVTWEGLSQPQRDTIFDYAVAHNLELRDVAICLDCP